MAGNTLTRMISILTKQTGQDAANVTGETNLDTLGIDSFDFIEFLFLVEDEFDVTIEAQFTDFGTRLKTIKDVADAVDALIAAKTSSKDVPVSQMSADVVTA